MKNKKQHFIPICYLKGFSNDQAGLYVYDKNLNKSFPSAIKQLCYQKEFYRIKEKFIEERTSVDFDPDFYETEFFANNIETNYARILTNLRANACKWLAKETESEVLNQIDKDHLATYIGIQFLRMPNVRENHYNAYKAMEDKRVEIAKAFVISQNPELKSAGENFKFDHDPDYGAIVHSWLFSNPRLINDIQDVLLKKCWSFFVSEKNELYSSDRPIVIIPRIPEQSYLYDGLGMRGAQIIFPLSGNILLSMWDPEFFDGDLYLADQFQPMHRKEKNLNNYYQYVNAGKQIYRGINDFTLIAEILKQNNGEPLFMAKPTIRVW